MQIVLCFFSALLLSYQAFSQEQFKVIKTNPQKNRAIVEMSPGKRPNTGDKYSYSGGEFAKTCDLSVVQVNESTMVLDYSHCEDKDQIKPGQTLSLTWTQGASEGGVATESPPSEGLPSKNESWYTLWGFGLSAGPRYSGGEAGNINDFDNLPGVRRSTVNYDLLGFYWPTSDHRSMYGVVMNMISDQFEDGFTTFSFSQALISFSYHSFLGVNIGDGWFWRGDIGLASFRATVDFGSYEVEGAEGGGFGFLVGGGYSFIIGTETRMPLGAYFTSRSVNSIRVNTLNLTLGFLF